MTTTAAWAGEAERGAEEQNAAAAMRWEEAQMQPQEHDWKALEHGSQEDEAEGAARRAPPAAGASVAEGASSAGAEGADESSSPRGERAPHSWGEPSFEARRSEASELLRWVRAPRRAAPPPIRRHPPP